MAAENSVAFSQVFGLLWLPTNPKQVLKEIAFSGFGFSDVLRPWGNIRPAISTNPTLKTLCGSGQQLSLFGPTLSTPQDSECPAAQNHGLVTSLTARSSGRSSGRMATYQVSTGQGCALLRSCVLHHWGIAVATCGNCPLACTNRHIKQILVLYVLMVLCFVRFVSFLLVTCRIDWLSIFHRSMIDHIP